MIRPKGPLTCQPRATPWERDPLECLSPERAEQLVFMISFVRLLWICAAPLGLGVFIDFVPGALPQAELWLPHSGRNRRFLQARDSIGRKALASGSFRSASSIQDQSSMVNKKGALKFRAPRDLNEIEAFAKLILRLQNMLAVFELFMAGVATVEHCFPGTGCSLEIFGLGRAVELRTVFFGGCSMLNPVFSMFFWSSTVKQVAAFCQNQSIRLYGLPAFVVGRSCRHTLLESQIGGLENVFHKLMHAVLNRNDFAVNRRSSRSITSGYRSV